MSTRRAPNDAALRSRETQVARLAPSDSGNFLSAAQNLTITDAEFNNVHGHRTNLVINLNQNSPAQSPSRTSDYTSMASSHRNSRINTLRAEPRAPQTFTASEQSNVIYQRHLELKGHGFPLWIPPSNQNLPIQYRRTGVRIGDVGIITPTGGFSFLFNICLPRDDPVNLRSLPEHFSPISPGPFIDKFPEFGHGSHLASTSIEKTQANSQPLGFQFESSASEGAILTMPLGATSESLENVAGFRRYAASNMVHWYKLVNVDLGREAKNGDIRLVIGCVKTKSWGIATFANQSRQSSCRLRFGPLSDPNSSRYFWEYSGTADVRAGPSPGENDELRQVDDSGDVVYENQCLFLRTLNPTLPDNVWSEIHHDPGSGDLKLQGNSHPSKDSASKATSTNRASATKTRSSTLSSHRFVNRRNLELQNNTVPSDKLAILDTDPRSSIISHPSNALNRILMEMVPTARMVITQDDDWSSVASKYDTIPDPHALLQQILVSHRICEEDGVVFLERPETIEGVSNAQVPVFESIGATAKALNTSIVLRPSLNLSSSSISTFMPSIFDRSSLRSSLDHANTLESFSSTSIYDSKPNLVDSFYSMEITGIIIKSPTLVAFIKLSIGSTFQRDFDFAVEKLKEVTLPLEPAWLSLPSSTTLILKVHQKGLLQRSKKLEIRYQDLLSQAITVDGDTNRREYRRTVNGIEVVIRFIISQETLLANTHLLSTEHEFLEMNTGVAEREVTIGGHDETPILEREQKKAATQQPTSMPATVPCQYRTGKTLGRGTYAIVKEAIHVETGKYFACKAINKNLVEGRERMVRNEIAVLKQISGVHRNIVSLHDFFETPHHFYLCFDLCTGGELSDRIHAKGNYYEADAAFLVDTIVKAIKYIHGSGIVHRNLNPENLLFRTPQEDADIILTGFGLSKIIREDKLNILTDVCGTPEYMAPEIFQKSGYGKPVDIWAIGVITYFLLAGYTPFDRDSQQQEMEAIIVGDYKFEPWEYWHKVSPTAKDFVRTCLTIDPAQRPTAEIALQHKWLACGRSPFVPDPVGGLAHLLPNVKRDFNAKQMWRKVALTIMAVNRMAALARVDLDPGIAWLREDIYGKYKESVREILHGSK